MKNDLNNLIKTLCCRLQFLWLHEAFVRFLQPTQNPCNVLIYSNMGGGGGKSPCKNKYTQIYTQNILFTGKNDTFYLQ
ncbi:MAG: hypothetical protein LBK94_11450 [Prevotellaceae bacterium]|jgi:hypothetical protein|nr:hypothetical protein [Prevotellaceae bacterium]